jgi:hypothetical protein
MDHGNTDPFVTPVQSPRLHEMVGPPNIKVVRHFMKMQYAHLNAEEVEERVQRMLILNHE